MRLKKATNKVIIISCMLLPEIAEFEFITFVETFPTAQFNSNSMEKKLMHDNVFDC